MAANRDPLTTLETPTPELDTPWEVTERTTTPTAPVTSNPEEIGRIQVGEEDRLAFRVGVNLITLVILGLGVYFLVRYLWF